MAETYTIFGTGDVVPNIKQTITDAVWTNTSGSLISMHTSSAQSASTGDYYYDVYHLDPGSASLAAIQFSIAYGHRYGSGSDPISDDSGDSSLTPSKAIYSQYRNFLLSATSEQFAIGSLNTDHIIAINLQRARCPEIMDPGNWELHMSSSAAGAGNNYSFIDDSTTNTTPTVGEGGIQYNIVSGSISDGINNTTVVGLMYPQHSLLIFDADVLRDTYNMTINTSSGVPCGNHGNILTGMKNSAAQGSDYGFKARKEENIRSTYYFCRVRNGDYNYSLNPSFYSGSDAKIRNADMLTNPQTYITTVGMYNDNNELLAVAKLSQPFRKNFHREAVIRVKLDF